MSLTQITLFVVLTFVFSLSIIRYSKKLREAGFYSIMKSQSTIHNIIKDVIPKLNKPSTEIKSQSRNYMSERMIKVVAIEGKAYWVKDNIFFAANMINGKVDPSSTHEINTLDMSKNDIDKMLFILDKLKDDEQ